MPALRSLRQGLDWGTLAPLRLRSRLVAEGVYAGAHRSARRGAGVEFGGHRAYTPGDDLRWLDRRSLLRHDRLLVRQFETETDRALRLVVDATSSMEYRGTSARGAKLAWAAVVAAALARIAIASGDPVALDFIGGGKSALGVSASGGREGFERVLGSLEAVRPAGDVWSEPNLVQRAFEGVARSARRGSILVVLSDLLDVPEVARDAVCALASRGRVLVVVQTLDPDEWTFPFESSVRLRSLEGGDVIESDGQARPRYLRALEELVTGWKSAVEARQGRFLRANTAHDPLATVRSIVEAAY